MLVVGGHSYPPQHVQDKASRPLSHASDTSAALFTLYLRISEEHDRRKYELFKGELDSILVFVSRCVGHDHVTSPSLTRKLQCGLFSATVAALIVPSIDESSNKNRDHSDNSTTPQAQWPSTRVLAPASYNTSSNSGEGVTPAESGPSSSGEGTTPEQTQSSSSWVGVGMAPTGKGIILYGGLGPKFSVVNMLWSYSLIFSIYCALHALILQRSAKPRTWVTSPHYSLPEQARMGVDFTRKIERADKTVKKVQFMIILSLLVFFAGLCTYLSSIDLITAIISGVLIAIYPFYLFPKLIIPHLCRIIKNLWPGFPHYSSSSKGYIQGSRFEDDVLIRTLEMSRSDDDLEEFFEAIPGFCASKIVDNPRRSLDALGLQTLAEALIGFWNRTLSSNRVPDSVKVRRLLTCVRLIEDADLSIAVPQILHLLYGSAHGLLRSVEVGHSLRTFRNGSVASLSQGIIACVTSNADRNDRWFTLALYELGISEGVLRDYLAHGDSVLLANLIHITRHFLHSLIQYDSADITRKSLSILSLLSKFDILNTLPELQHDFCNLWNEIVHQARKNEADDNPFIDILVEICRLYVALHGTDIALGYLFTSTAGHDDLSLQPASYPLCMIPDHHPKPTTPAQEASNSTTGGTSQTMITTASPSLSGSSPGDTLDVSHHTANQGVADSDSSIPSMSEPVTQSPSVQSANGRRIVSSMLFDSSVIRSDIIFYPLESGSFVF